MHQACTQLLTDRGIENFDVLEISSGEYWRILPFRSYREINFPEYGICKDILDDQFNLIIADQHLEERLLSSPDINTASGVPNSRNLSLGIFRSTITSKGGFAGNLYALSQDFVTRIRVKNRYNSHID